MNKSHVTQLWIRISTILYGLIVGPIRQNFGPTQRELLGGHIGHRSYLQSARLSSQAFALCI